MLIKIGWELRSIDILRAVVGDGQRRKARRLWIYWLVNWCALECELYVLRPFLSFQWEP